MRLNDESRAETGELIHHDTSGSDAMAEHLEEEVGLHTESGAVDVDTNYDASEVLEEPVEVETPVRRTMMDLIRNGTNEKIGGDYTDYVMNITVKNALKTRGAEAEQVILKELSQMIHKKVWQPIHLSSLNSTDRTRIIRSQMFLKEKFLPLNFSNTPEGRNFSFKNIWERMILVRSVPLSDDRCTGCHTFL